MVREACVHVRKGLAYMCATALPTRVHVSLFFQGTVELGPPREGFTIATDRLSQIQAFAKPVAASNSEVATAVARRRGGTSAASLAHVSQASAEVHGGC